MKDTPRTNKAFLDGYTFCKEDMMPAVAFASQLETELTAAQEEIEMLNIRYGAAAMHHDNNMGEVMDQRDRLAEAVNAATILIAAKGRHNTMLAYNGLRDALQSLTNPNEPCTEQN
jgi:hypothetical protein